MILTPTLVSDRMAIIGDINILRDSKSGAPKPQPQEKKQKQVQQKQNRLRLSRLDKSESDPLELLLFELLYYLGPRT